MIRTLLLGTTLSLSLLAYAGDDKAGCPMHAEHMAAAAKQQQHQHVKADGSAAHGQEVDQRHDTFGMPHDASTHSFRLFADGGAIELRANDRGDAKVIAAIQQHLQDIAGEFKKGDFSTPRFVHGYTPQGVEAMAQTAKTIEYRYEMLPAGGRIRLTTKDAKALAAVHDFLRFQVIEHRTANSGQIEKDE